MKLFFVFFISFSIASISFSQFPASFGRLQGTATDINTGETLSFANIKLKQNDSIIKNISSDLEGKYMFSNLKQGDYTIEITFVSYDKQRITNIPIKPNRITFLDIHLQTSNLDTDGFTVIKYKSPPIQSCGSTSSSGTLTKEELAVMPKRSVSGIAQFPIASPKLDTIGSFRCLPKETNNKCSLYGKVIDKKTGETLPFVNVTLAQNKKVIKGTSSDLEGKYCFINLPDGLYDLEVNFVGYKKVFIHQILISKEKVIIQDVALESGELQLEEFTIVSDKSRLIGLPGRSAGRIASQVGGVVTNSNGNITSVRGNNTHYYIDGIKVNPNSESYDIIKENDFLRVDKEPLSTFSIDVDKASYSNIRRYINQGSLPPKDAVRIEEMINYFDYDYPQSTSEHPFSINTEYTNCPWNKDHRLVSIALQGNKIDMKSAPANNLVFLLDVSGSMNSPNKLGLLKAGLNLLIDQLREKDKVSIIVYAGAAGVVLKPTSGKNKEKIREALNQLEAGGSTAGGAGIKLAYKLAKKSFIKKGNNRIILATDGDFNVGVSGDEQLIKLIEKKREDDIFLSVLGFGTGNYKDSKMEKIADKGNGNYAYIDNILEAKKVLVKEMGGTLLTLAKDVKLQIEFNPEHVKSYRLIGYENRKLNNEDFNDDSKDAGELGSGHTVTALYEIVPASLPDSLNPEGKLKYQSQPLVSKNSNSNEILTVKFRYKEPKGDKSKLITHVVYDELVPFKKSSENLRYSCSVIEFGMILRESSYLGTSTFDSCIALAKASKGKDEEGYRAEFIKIVETAQLLEKSIVKEN